MLKFIWSIFCRSEWSTFASGGFGLSFEIVCICWWFLWCLVSDFCRKFLDMFCNGKGYYLLLLFCGCICGMSDAGKIIDGIAWYFWLWFLCSLGVLRLDISCNIWFYFYFSMIDILNYDCNFFLWFEIVVFLISG